MTDQHEKEDLELTEAGVVREKNIEQTFIIISLILCQIIFQII